MKPGQIDPTGRFRVVRPVSSDDKIADERSWWERFKEPLLYALVVAGWLAVVLITLRYGRR